MIELTLNSDVKIYLKMDVKTSKMNSDQLTSVSETSAD